jgi:hypothetical protein
LPKELLGLLHMEKRNTLYVLEPDFAAWLRAGAVEQQK